MTTTLVTGANRGIGLALAAHAVELGHTVIGTAREPSAAKDLAATGARVLQLDVADPGSCDALAAELGGEPIDVLINNAATFPNRTGLAGIEADAFEETLRVNVRGPILVTRALLGNLQAGERKTVVTVSSSMGSISKTAKGGSYAYRMSKAAVNMMAKSLAAEFADMVFLALDPGWVRTDMGGSDAALSPAESASGMLKVIEHATAEQSGAFLRYDGEVLPW